MLGATRKISEIINETAEETAGKEQLAVAPGSSLLRLDQVSFAYQDLPVLEKVDLEARSGEKIALVGATGAGKTTLANVITRLYPVAAGRISLNGQASTDFSLEQWRGFFSVVLQENTIISGSIRDNLTLGLNRKVTDQELWDVLALVRLEEYAKKLPKGLDSLLGESGKQLSGGQRQRMQIARACLRDFKFLLLDEATSNLDADTEKIIMTALDRLKRTKNCGQITIAHRLATIANSDRIYFIKNKTVVASGSHEELLEKSSRLSPLCS